MTTKTRRTLFVSVLLLALALPAETILLKALQSPTDAVAIQRWATTLDDARLATAASRIQSYPFAYRKEIMRKLTPEQRSSVWRNHITTYIQQHPELASDAVTALNAAVAAVTPDALSRVASKAERLSTTAIAEQVQTLLGKDTAKYLFYTLGPADDTIASREPLTMKLASYVRNHFVVQARQSNCDCASWFGCDVWGTICSTTYYCYSFSSWPACGWWWNYECDGACMAY